MIRNKLKLNKRARDIFLLRFNFLTSRANQQGIIYRKSSAPAEPIRRFDISQLRLLKGRLGWDNTQALNTFSIDILQGNRKLTY